MAAVGNDFIAVHVALSARSSLPDHQGKLIAVLSCNDFIADLTDEVRFAGIHSTQLCIGHGCGFFQVSKGLNDGFWHACFRPNFEIVA